MVLVMTALGFFLARQEFVFSSTLFWTLLGSALTCGGGGALNSYLERDVDCLMRRTQRRPLPRGLVAPAEALGFGLLLTLVGTLVLVAFVNLLTGFLALLTVFLYVLVYTPLKRMTALNTLIGAIPGALPPVGGWTAAVGTLDAGAWALFLILFVWQHPHFYAIAWMYRDDYRRGGFKMLPLVDTEDGLRTTREIIVYLLLLIPVSLLPCLMGLAGLPYLLGACIAGVYFLLAGVRMFGDRSPAAARKVLRASIIYLPILFSLIALDLQVSN